MSDKRKLELIENDIRLLHEKYMKHLMGQDEGSEGDFWIDKFTWDLAHISNKYFSSNKDFDL